MTTIPAKISRRAKNSLADVIQVRTIAAVNNLKIVVQRSDNLDEVQRRALDDAIDAMQLLNNSLSTMSAAQGHKQEMSIELNDAAEELAQVGTLSANLRAYMQASPEFLAEHLADAQEDVIRRAIDFLSADDKAKLMRAVVE